MEEYDFDIEGLDASAVSSGLLSGFAVVRVNASPTHRYVEARGYLNGKLVCSASGADQNVTNVRSTATQSFTLPVPKGAKLKITTNLSNNAGHVFGEFIKA